MNSIVTQRSPKLYFKYKEEYDEVLHNYFSRGSNNDSDRPRDGLSWFLISPQVIEFEEKMAKRCGRKYAVMTHNCTTALYLANRTIGILTNFENNNVLTTGYVYVAPVDQALSTGFNVFLNDVCGSDCHMVLENKHDVKFSTMISVGLFGSTVNYDDYIEFKERHKIKYWIQDSAQSFGTTWNSVPSDSFGDMTCLSFCEVKNFTCPIGTGGMVLTDNDEMYSILIALRKNGNIGGNYLGGINGYAPSVLSAMLLVSEKHFDEEIRHKKTLLKLYDTLIHSSPLNNHITTYNNFTEESVPQKYPIFVKSSEEKKKLKKFLKDNYNISISSVYPYKPVSENTYKYNNTRVISAKLPVSKKICDTVLALPIQAEISMEEVELVICAIKDFYNV